MSVSEACSSSDLPWNHFYKLTSHLAVFSPVTKAISGKKLHTPSNNSVIASLHCPRTTGWITSALGYFLLFNCPFVPYPFSAVISISKRYSAQYSKTTKKYSWMWMSLVSSKVSTNSFKWWSDLFLLNHDQQEALQTVLKNIVNSFVDLRIFSHLCFQNLWLHSPYLDMTSGFWRTPSCCTK